MIDVGRSPNPAIVSFDERPTNCQSHPHTFRFCREECFENAIGVFGINAHSRVFYRYQHTVGILKGSFHPQEAPRGTDVIASAAFLTKLAITCRNWPLWPITKGRGLLSSVWMYIPSLSNSTRMGPRTSWIAPLMPTTLFSWLPFLSVGGFRLSPQHGDQHPQ
jgi:hypothetical protein